MRRFRKSEKDEIREHVSRWTQPLHAYPAAVATFFGVEGAGVGRTIRDVSPSDRATW